MTKTRIDKHEPDSSHLMRIREFAAAISVSVRKLYRMIDAGEIPQPVKQGAGSFFFRSDLDDYLKKLKEQRS